MKPIVSFIFLLSSLFGSVGPDGWVSLEKPQKESLEKEFEGGDLSMGVLFSKKVEGESFLVRFPANPEYAYLADGELELVSVVEGRKHVLRVLSPSHGEFSEKRGREIALYPETVLIERERVDANHLELFYHSKDKWVHETLIFTPHHLYFFQTENLSLEPNFHREFVDSFSAKSID